MRKTKPLTRRSGYKSHAVHSPNILLAMVFFAGLLLPLRASCQTTSAKTQLSNRLDSCELWADVAPGKGLKESLALFKVARNQGDTARANAALLWAGKSLVNLSRFDSAITVLSSPLEYFRNHHSRYGVLSLYQLALSYYYLGNYEPAQTFLFEAQAHPYLKEDPALNIKNIHLLGEVNRAAGIYSIAKSYFHQALGLALQHHHRERQTAALNRLGYTSYQLSQPDSAVYYLEQSLKLAREINNQDWIATNYNDLGEVYSDEKNYARAKALYTEALEIVKDPDQRINAYNNLAAVHRSEKNYEQAIFHVNQALVLARQTNILSHQLRALEVLADIYKDKGELATSAEYYKQYLETYRAFQKKNRIGKMNQLEINFRNRQKQLELETLKLEAKKEKLQSQVYYAIALLTFFLVVIAVFIYSAFQKTKAQRALAAKANAEALAEVESAQRQLAEQELDHQKRELMAQSVQLIRHTDKIDQIREQVNSLTEPTLVNLKRTLKGYGHQEKDWAHFDQSFTKLHPHFIASLLQLNPSLTQKEKRLATLVKTGMSSQEIAALLGISRTSVNQSKYRLKKKLKLEQEQSLEVFFESIAG